MVERTNSMSFLRGVGSSFKKQPLKRQILIVYIPLLLLSIILVFAFINNVGTQSHRQEAYYQMENKADVTKAILEERMEASMATFLSIERSEAFSNAILDYRFGKKSNTYTHLMAIGSELDEAYDQNFNIIDSVYINLNGNEYTHMKRMTPIYSKVDVEEMYYEFGGSGKYIWLPLHEDDIFTAEKRDVFSIVKFFGTPSEGGNVFGVMVLNIRKEYILEALESVSLSENGYWLVNAEGELFSARENKGYGLRSHAKSYLDDNSGTRGRFESISQGGESLYVYYDTTTSGWELIGVMPKRELSFLSSHLNFTSLILVMGVIAVMMFFANLFAGRISMSITELSEQVEDYDGDGLPRTNFREEGSREVKKLSDALNRMSGTIHRLIESIFERQQCLRRVELAALQEKIKPHFLYNSLSTVLYDIDRGNNLDASEMLRSLITFLRLSVDKGNEFSTIRDELKQVESYLRIQQLRGIYRFDYEIHMDEDIGDYEILKFTLQPLVENSLKHGFMSRPDCDDNKIIINIVQEGEDLQIEVFDNGSGIDGARLEELTNDIKGGFSDVSSTTYGLKNVDLRIRIVYGDPYGISIESESGESSYTSITTTIPMKKMPLP